MSDLQWLFLILALLYVWECLCWLPRGGVAFVSWLGKHWQLAQPGSLGNQRGGFVLATPLPPLGSLLTAAQFPLSLSPDGVLAFVSTNVNRGWRVAQSGRFLPFAEVRDVRVKNKQVIVNAAVLHKCPSPQAARELADVLDRLAKLPEARRAEAIMELLRGTFDLAAAKKRWEAWRFMSGPLRWNANTLFVYLFIAVPMVIWFIGFKLTWLWLLLGLLTFTVSLAVMVYRAHRVLYPAEEDERFAQVITTALSPANAVRALDALSRPLLQNFHPLVLAKLFLDKPAFSEFASQVLRDVRHPALPVCPSNEPVHIATELHWRTALRTSLEDFLKRSGLSLDELTRPPQPADETCRAYCARCLTQFTTPDGTCADCGGLPLVAFTK